MSGKRLERKIPLGKAMNSSIKNNILIDEFHGNALPFNIFIKLYIYTTKAFCLLDIHGLRPLAFFSLFLMHATIDMWNNLKLFFSHQ